MSKIQELEIEVAKQKSRADTWEKAYFLLVKRQIDKETTVSQKPFTLAHVVEEENKATNFVNVKVNELVERGKQEGTIPASFENEMQVQGVWVAWLGRAIWNLIKDEALAFIAKTMDELKEKGAQWAMDVAKWLLNELQQYLYEKFQASHSEEEQEHFKKKIIEDFPDTELAKRLKGS